MFGLNYTDIIMICVSIEQAFVDDTETCHTHLGMVVIKDLKLAEKIGTILS